MKAYVLAGGASSRMGSDKARLPLDGWPVAVRLYERLEAAGHRASLVRRAPDGLPWTHPDGRPLRVVREPTDGERHPLRGIHTALLDAGGEPVLCIPCDLPALSVHALRLLPDRPCATAHPLVGVFPPDLARLEQAIARGDSARSFGAGLPRVELPEAALHDRNTWEGELPFLDLLERVAGVRGHDRDRLVRGEIARLAARGVVLPDAVLYAPPSGG